MKIAIEANIPYIKGRLENVAEVVYLAPEEFTKDSVKDVDTMIVRTRTNCNKDLLEDSKCRFIGTATIGTDHIDKKYCQDNNIEVVSAPGCNAPAVAQYVYSVIAHWMKSKNIPFSDANKFTIGIVGVGNVGSIVERWGVDCGFKVLVCDPPRQRQEHADKFVSLDTIAKEADFITFHTPLTKTGEDATYHLCNADFINKLERCKLLINSARGPITDTQDLLVGIENGKIGDLVIDCWESEPNINSTLLEKAFVATPHIAGYSQQGKERATSMMIEAINNHYGFNIAEIEIDKPKKGAENVSLEEVYNSYNPLAETQTLRTTPETFESQRNNYHYRQEV